MAEHGRKLSTPRALVQRKTNTSIPAPGSPHTSQEHTTAQRYRDTLQRTLDDGCQACNMVTADCTDKRQRLNEPCCGMCGHP